MALFPWFLHVLQSSPFACAALIIAVGYLLGHIRFPGGFELGLAGVLFAGLGIGILSLGIKFPPELQMGGLVLFVYCIGLEAGPGFLHCFRSGGGLVLILCVVGLILAAALCWLAAFEGIASPGLLTGLFCGALNNTPALAAAVETAKQEFAGDKGLPDQIIIGYGNVYPFTIVSLMLVYQRLIARDRKRHPEGCDPGAGLAMHPAATVRVTAMQSDGCPWTAGALTDATGAVLSRFRTADGSEHVALPESVLPPGTDLMVVAEPAQLARVEELAGRRTSGHLELIPEGIQVCRYMVTNSDISDHPLSWLQPKLAAFGAVLTRLRRGDMNLPVSSETVIKLGDFVRIVSPPGSESALTRLFGNSLHGLAEAGLLSAAFGILAGLLLGAIPVSLPMMHGSISLGAAGGPLVMGLLFGYLGRTGFIVWSIPLSSNLALRNLGLALFFAGAGLNAGGGLVKAFQNDGVRLIVTGILVLACAQGVLAFGARFMGRFRLTQLFGFSSALQTQPALLAFALKYRQALDTTESYALVFPVATVAKILLAQILLLMSHGG